MGWLVDLRDAFASELDSLGFDNVEAEWVPIIEREKLQSRETHVFPAQRKVNSASRGYKKREAIIAVMLVEALPKDGEAAIAAAMEEVDGLDGLLNSKIGEFTITEINQPRVIDPDEWRANRSISITVLFTFEGIST